MPRHTLTRVAPCLFRKTMTATGYESWLCRLVVHGERHDFILGSCDEMSEAEAAAITASYRRKRTRRSAQSRFDEVLGRSPTARRREAVAPAPVMRHVPTFGEFAERVIDARVAHGEWDAKSRTANEWRQSLRDHAAALAPLGVDAITITNVKAVLDTLSKAGYHDKARRLRQRIDAVMQAAIEVGYREDNPAKVELRKRARKEAAAAEAERGHAALPFREVPGAIVAIRASDKRPAIKLAAEMLALTASRSKEVREATWAEVDLPGRKWHRPGAHMKSGIPHTVELSDAAMAVLEQARALGDGSGLIFPRDGSGKPIPTATFSRDVRELTGATAHGLRHSFKNWCRADRIDNDVSELCLSHRDADKLAAIYGDDPGAIADHTRNAWQRWAHYLTNSA